MIEHYPERGGLERAEVGNLGDENVPQAFPVQRQRQVMMIDDVVALLWPEYDRDHVASNEFADLLRFALAQLFAPLLDLVHANRDLSRAQTFDRHGIDKRLTRVGHRCLLSQHCPWVGSAPARTRSVTACAG